jgi:hypothetical protein
MKAQASRLTACHRSSSKENTLWCVIKDREKYIVADELKGENILLHTIESVSMHATLMHGNS